MLVARVPSPHVLLADFHSVIVSLRGRCGMYGACRVCRLVCLPPVGAIPRCRRRVRTRPSGYEVDVKGAANGDLRGH